MKRLFNSSLFALTLLAGTATCLSLSCKKDNNAPALALLQHKWQIVSLNGEAFRHVGQPGDYFDFGSNKQLVEYVGNSYDTLNYQVTDGGTALQLYPIVNSVQTGVMIPLTIKSLTTSQLILLSGKTMFPTYIIDSLRR